MTVSTDLDRRFRVAAAAAGLLDVAYDLVDSPLGPLLVAATTRGVCRISFDPEPEEEAETLARRFGVRVLRTPLDGPRRELDEYFEGRRQTFDLDLDLAATAPFNRRVLAELAPVLESSVGAERAEERLLERVLRVGPSELAAQEREDLPAVRLVEPLEGWNRHGLHHRV